MIAQSPAGAALPDYSAFTASYLLPFAGRADFAHLDETLKVRAQINGGPIGRFTVDTGSIGIVIGADDVPNLDPNAKPGMIRYSSSGLELHGVWTTANVTFPDAQGGPGVASSAVPVLAVSSEVCTGVGVNADRCTASDHPHPHMMGVGFGRSEDAHPERNPFLNLREMTAGTMRRGYLITPRGITLGLTNADVGPGFTWQKLSPRPLPADLASTLKDYETAPGSFQAGNAQSGPGMVLIDTGLTNMMLADPNSTASGDVPGGTLVTIGLLSGQAPYSFTVGDKANPLTPRRVSWVKASHGVFVNTGLHVLSKFDYLFDEDGGWVGLRAR